MPYIFRTQRATISGDNGHVIQMPLVSAQLIHRREAGVMSKPQETVLAEAHGLDAVALENFKVASRKAFGLPSPKRRAHK